MQFLFSVAREIRNIEYKFIKTGQNLTTTGKIFSLQEKSGSRHLSMRVTLIDFNTMWQLSFVVSWAMSAYRTFFEMLYM